MAAQWFYRTGDQEFGPVTGAALRDLVLGGELVPESLVRKDRDGAWVAARRVKGLPFPAGSVTDTPSPIAAAAMGDRATLLAVATPAVAARDDLANAREIVQELAGTTAATPKATRGRRGLVLGIAALLAVAVVVAGIVAFWPGTAPVASSDPNNSALEHELNHLKQELAEVKRRREADANSDAEPTDEQNTDAAQNTSDTPSAVLRSASSSPRVLPSELSPPQPAAPPDEPTPPPTSAPEIVATVRKALVFIEATAAGGDTTVTGSGFVADEAGLIVTNHHVVEGAAKVTVTFSDGRRAPVTEWVAASVGTDLVLLRVSVRGVKLTPLTLAESLPQPGADVLAIGAPLGRRETVTKGIVSAIRKGSEVPGGRDGIDEDSVWIQTSAQIAHGSSGGPLVDSLGSLVGVNTSMFIVGPQKGNVPFNYAVGVDEVRRLLSSASRSGQPLASLPRSRKARPARPTPNESRAVAEALAAAQAAREKRRLDSLQRIYEQRLVIFNNWESTRNRALQIDGQLKAAQVVYARAEAAATAAKKNGVAIRRQVQRLENDLLYTRDPAAAERIRVRIQLLETEYRSYESKFRQAEAERNEAYEVGRDLQTKLQVENGEMERLRREADQLETEWLTLMDPWGNLSRGAHERVVDVASQWIVLHEKNPLPYLVRADAYANLGRFNQAVNDLNKAVSLSPNTAGPLAYRGWAFSTAGDYRRALADFGKALQIDRANATVYLFKAQTLAKKRDYSLAVKDFGVAMNLSPSDPEVLRAYAFFMATCSNDGYRKGKKAVDYARTACELTNWTNWSCLDALAAASAEFGDFVAAEKWGAKALELAPEQARSPLRDRLALYESKRAIRIP